jgi:hypothetical protein
MAKKKIVKKRARRVKQMGPKRAMYPVGNMGRGGPYYITQEAPKVELPKELLDYMMEKTAKVATTGSNVASTFRSVANATQSAVSTGANALVLYSMANQYFDPEGAAKARAKAAGRTAEEYIRTGYEYLKGGARALWGVAQEAQEQDRKVEEGGGAFAQTEQDKETVSKPAYLRPTAKKKKGARSRLQDYWDLDAEYTPKVPKKPVFVNETLRSISEEEKDMIAKTFKTPPEVPWVQTATMTGAGALLGYAKLKYG